MIGVSKYGWMYWNTMLLLMNLGVNMFLHMCHNHLSRDARKFVRSYRVWIIAQREPIVDEIDIGGKRNADWWSPCEANDCCSQKKLTRAPQNSHVDLQKAHNNSKLKQFIPNSFFCIITCSNVQWLCIAWRSELVVDDGSQWRKLVYKFKRNSVCVAPQRED